MLALNMIPEHEVTPKTVESIYKSIYIPDKTKLFAKYLGGDNINLTKSRIPQLKKYQLLEISIVDMRSYPNNGGQWIIAGQIVNNNDKQINNQVLEFQYPRDKFMLVKIPSLQQLAKKALIN